MTNTACKQFRPDRSTQDLLLWPGINRKPTCFLGSKYSQRNSKNQLSYAKIITSIDSLDNILTTEDVNSIQIIIIISSHSVFR